MSVLRRIALLVAVLALGVTATPAVAQQQQPTTTTGLQTMLPRAPSDPNALSRPETLTRRPVDHRLNGRQARAIASRAAKVRRALLRDPAAKPEVFLKGPTRWQVSWFTPQPDRREVAQVLIDDATGAVVEAWDGPQVAWTMARGYPGAFGRKVNSPWVWIPLTLLFVAPFVTPWRPWRMLHLDLLVLAGFGVSVAFFNDANLDASVPLVFPLLGYLLVRALWVATRSREDDRRPVLPLLVPVSWLAVGLVFLIGFRVGLNIADSNVIDVGYSGVIGADKLMDGEPLYGAFPPSNPHGDTYGPVAYLAYVPFEQVLPWSGVWDDLPAAHAAAIAFDLLCLGLLFLVGRRLGGRGLGIVLAWLWVTWPFTIYASNTNTNDALVALFALLAVAAAGSPPARGAAAALGGLAKFASLGLVPLLATHGARRDTWWRTVVPFGLVFAGVALVVMLPIVAQGESLQTMYDRTLGYQASRGAPFSIWGLWGIEGLQHVWQALAALLALGAAVLPRRRDAVGLAALGAAVLIALQMGLTYWFYLYLVWFFPLLLVALLARFRVPERA